MEMCAYAGFDFIILDNEHGSADFGVTEHMLRAARAAGIAPVVRCFEHDLPRILDMGASAVQVPMVQSASQARRLADMVRYPPLGKRGSAFSTRAAGYGAFGGDGHTQRSNDGVVFVAMIETPEAIEFAADIAAVPGVDVVFIGPNDLAHAMGHGSNWDAAPVQQAIRRGLEAVAAAGKCPGIIALTPADEEKYRAWGAATSPMFLPASLRGHWRKPLPRGGIRNCAIERGRWRDCPAVSEPLPSYCRSRFQPQAAQPVWLRRTSAPAMPD